ncbi:MAG TPA: NfeD family protein [Candidatus Limnocylindria bacterium]|jgi:membrane protein implicated in regulation of membrane protease activity|nr:NfeD family protein [Candidatus Limnocylindria bacterium]
MDTTFLIYLVCFGVGLLFTLVSGVLGGVFGGHEMHGGDVADTHAEGGFASHEMPGFSPLSPTTLATFVTAFGGLGMVFHSIPATRNPFLSAPLAVLGALAVATLVFWLFRTIFRRTQASSESRVATLIGSTAVLNSSLPENGVGEITYVQAGSRYTAPARAEGGAAIARGSTVRITRIVGTEFFVTPV